MDVNRLCLHCMREGMINGVCTHCGRAAGARQEPPFALPMGTILHGRYLTGAVLGCGGFGITYVAVDLQNEHRVAVKEYLPNSLGTRRPGDTLVSACMGGEDFRYGLSQFLEEARIIYECQENPNIISVEKLFEENGTAYYVMEYLQGCDLKHHLEKSGGRISHAETLRLLKPIFGALSLVHSRGIIHRDISPDNIYLCEDGSVRLLDFGAARASLREKSQSMDVILKRGYAPEEQYRTHGKQGPWTDVYALGCTIYRCITGTVPPEATQRQHQDACVPLSQACAGVPVQLDTALRKAMEVRLENRFQSVQDFYIALYGEEKPPPSVISSRTVPAEPAPKPKVVTSSPTLEEENKTGKRIGAYVLDNLALGVVSNLIFRMLSFSSLESLYGFTFLLFFLYGFLFENSSKHATLGKRAMKLQVTDLSGEAPSRSALTLRNVIKYGPLLLNMLSPFLGAALVLIDCGVGLFSSSKQAIHDLVAKTRVTLPVRYQAKLVPLSQAVQKPPVKAANTVGVHCVSGIFQGSFFPLDQNKLVIGRNVQSCHLIFPNDTMGVSGVHCELFWDPGSCTIVLKDLGSTYGTFVSDGRKLGAQQMAALRNGDSFTIGDKNTFLVKTG